MYTDNFLSQMNSHISAQKNLWLKLGASVKKAIFNVSVCQVSWTKDTHKNYYILFKQVYETAFCSD